MAQHTLITHTSNRGFHPRCPQTFDFLGRVCVMDFIITGRRNATPLVEMMA